MNLHDGARGIRPRTPQFLLDLVGNRTKPKHVGDVDDNPHAIPQRRPLRLSDKFQIQKRLTDMGLVTIHEFIGGGINALHSRKHDLEVQLYAFDVLALDGDDLRGLPLSMRKTNLDRLLSRAGVCSREQARTAVAAGRAQVNGVVVRDPDAWIDVVRDRVRFDGVPLRARSKAVWMLHKPCGYVTTLWRCSPTTSAIMSP